MKSRATPSRTLLAIDAFVNLGLGLFLLLASAPTPEALGLPAAGAALYRVVLGGMLLGIGLALMISFWGPTGLGLAGALAINFCGAAAVIAWLIFSPAQISPGGVGSPPVYRPSGDGHCHRRTHAPAVAQGGLSASRASTPGASLTRMDVVQCAPAQLTRCQANSGGRPAQRSPLPRGGRAWMYDPLVIRRI